MTKIDRSERKDIDDHFRMIADTAPVLIWMSNARKQCEFVNKGWLDFTGETLEKILGDGWIHCIHPDDVARVAANYDANFEKQIGFEQEMRLKRHDGEYRWMLDKGVSRFDTDGTFIGYIGSVTDIHDTKLLNDILEEKVHARTSEILRQAQELKDNRDFSDTVFNASVDVMLVYGKDLEFLAVNDAAKRMYGLKDEVIGRKLTDVYPQSKGTSGYEDLLRALKGETIHNPVYKSVIKNIYYEDFMIPLKKDDEIYAVLVIARDITERINSELELKQLNDRLVSQNHELQSTNEDLESFNYIASHDLQEPLRKVNMFAGRILDVDGSKLSAQSSEYFERMTSAINRMQKLIQSLLEYSSTNAENVKFVKTNLNKIIKEVKTSLEEVISGKNATVFSDELPSISVIPIQFQQLLHNLISNALKYSKPDRAPIVKISAEIVAVEERANKEFWKISVSDNGIGFDPVYKQKIFELFQRLHGKQEYEGTGIGR
ncbi:MAG: PAS domain S-box protein [Flavobacterium sp.]|uniref:PAS domain-containing sensor histidine kinase n=1 Tax=Flavobacterium sp. TaxID=239 RepID=UPI00121EBDF8|nr:PAS domain S-box protein [Flavobacterium sp.]RZJ65938.1 MAG: PAS domain S-box protein [Flavobacterium sp.]